MNETVKCYAKSNNVKLWQIADALGMKDSNFSKRLRYQFTLDEEKAIREIVDKIASEQQNQEEGFNNEG